MLLLRKKSIQSQENTLVNTLTESTCSYPLKIETLFPYWLTDSKKDTDPPTLIDLIKQYYKWLYCKTTADITPNFGFFEIDKIKNLNNLDENLIEIFIKTYIPSLNPSILQTSFNPGGEISQQEIKTLLNSVKNKLYGKKGTEASFKYLISLIFNIDPKDIYITYPKKYLMVLNGGSNSSLPGIDTTRKGILNFSILSDDYVWNDYSYVINITGTGDAISGNRYENIIKPLLHPSGLNDLYQEQKIIFNPLNENFDIRVYEVPLIKNYLGYKLTDSSTYPGICNFSTYGKQYVFPDWDRQINTYTRPFTFADIKISDFLVLEPTQKDENDEYIFPNDARENTPC